MENTIVEGACCEFDKNGDVCVKTTAKNQHSVTNTSGNRENDTTTPKDAIGGIGRTDIGGIGGTQLTNEIMHSEVLNWMNQAQGSTWMFPVAPALLQHQRNASNLINNIVNSTKLSRDNFGVGESSINESTVAQSLPYSH